MSNEPPGLFEFGSYRLIASKRLLTRLGESLVLASKTIDFRLLLIGGQGRVLAKTDLVNGSKADTQGARRERDCPQRARQHYL